MLNKLQQDISNSYQLSRDVVVGVPIRATITLVDKDDEGIEESLDDCQLLSADSIGISFTFRYVGVERTVHYLWSAIVAVSYPTPTEGAKQ